MAHRTRWNFTFSSTLVVSRMCMAVLFQSVVATWLKLKPHVPTFSPSSETRVQFVSLFCIISLGSWKRPLMHDGGGNARMRMYINIEGETWSAMPPGKPSGNIERGEVDHKRRSKREGLRAYWKQSSVFASSFQPSGPLLLLQYYYCWRVGWCRVGWCRV